MPDVNSSNVSDSDSDYKEEDSEGDSNDVSDFDDLNTNYTRIRNYCPPKGPDYVPEKLLTKVTVLQQQELGIVSCIIQKKKNSTNKDLTKKVTICERKDMQATATRYAKNVIKSSSYFILENTDDPRYELAKEYHPPDDEIFPPSWA